MPSYRQLASQHSYDAYARDDSLKQCIEILDGKGMLMLVNPFLPPLEWKEVKSLTTYPSVLSV